MNILRKKSIFLKLLTFSIAIISTLFFVYLFSKTKPNSVVLNIYNWGEFISSGSDGNVDVNQLFTDRTGIRINYNTFQSNEEMLAKIIGGGADYDIICPSDYMISKLIKKNVLAQINFENIPNYKFIDESLKNLSFDPENKYSVPYLWGTLGIFYNKKFVDEKISWNSLWNKKYSQKILMFDNPRDSLSISMIKNGKSVNSNNKGDWYESFKDLKSQRALVQNYMSDQIYDKLMGEEAYIAPYYYGYRMPDILSENENISFSIPTEGTIKFVDSMCILKNSKHKSEAEKYINFLCEYEISLLNAKATGNLPANKDTISFLEKENNIKNLDNIKNAEVLEDLPQDISKMNDELWLKVKAGENSSKIYDLILILIFLGFTICIFVFFKRSKI